MAWKPSKSLLELCAPSVKRRPLGRSNTNTIKSISFSLLLVVRVSFSLRRSWARTSQREKSSRTNYESTRSEFPFFYSIFLDCIKGWKVEVKATRDSWINLLRASQHHNSNLIELVLRWRSLISGAPTSISLNTNCKKVRLLAKFDRVNGSWWIFSR